MLHGRTTDQAPMLTEKQLKPKLHKASRAAKCCNRATRLAVSQPCAVHTQKLTHNTCKTRCSASHRRKTTNAHSLAHSLLSISYLHLFLRKRLVISSVAMSTVITGCRSSSGVPRAQLPAEAALEFTEAEKNE